MHWIVGDQDLWPSGFQTRESLLTQLWASSEGEDGLGRRDTGEGEQQQKRKESEV